jgi:hypothetical protein
MNVTTEKVEWLRERNCVYTLMHHGWHNGTEMKRNRLYFMVQRDSTVTEQEAEEAAALIAKAVNAHNKLVEALKSAMKTADFEKHPYRRWHTLAADALAAAGEPV